MNDSRNTKRTSAVRKTERGPVSADECNTTETGTDVLADLGRFPYHDACDITLLLQDIFNLFGREQPASADTWTGGRDLLFPGVAVHVLGPERPGTALPGSGSIDIAFVAFKERAVLVIIFEFIETVDFFCISRGKLRQGHVKMRGQTPPVIKRQVNVPISPTRYAAPAVTLAFKAYPVLKKLLSLTHRFPASLISVPSSRPCILAVYSGSIVAISENDWSWSR
jgi:hypothetical protein